MDGNVVKELESDLEIASESVIEVLRSFEKQVFQDLEKTAPRTTIETEIFWGSPDQMQVDYTEIDFNYKTFLKAAMIEFLTSRASLPKEYRLDEDVEFELFVENEERLSSLPAQDFWNDFLGSLKTQKGGGLVPNTGDLWMPSLPPEAIEKMEKSIEQRISKDSPFHILKFFPEFLNSQNGSIEYNKFLASISHELTHLYVLENTEIKKYITKNSSNEVRGLFENSTVETVEESFAYVSGRVISDYKFVPEGYSEPGRIEWCIEIIQEKLKEVEGSEIDWARKKAVDVLENIEQKGLISRQTRKDPLIYFLKSCLPYEEKSRLRKLNQIVEEDLSEGYAELRKAVREEEKLERRENNERIFEEFRKAEKEVEWQNPDEIEEVILHEILEAAIGQYSLNKVHQEAGKAVKREIKNLQQIIQIFTDLESEIRDENIDREIIRAIKDLRKTEKELETLI